MRLQKSLSSTSLTLRIAGDFDINVNTMTINSISGSELSQVSVDVVNPVTLSSAKEQNLYLNILAADYSNKEVWVVVELVDESDGKKVTIPTRQTGLKFEAGKTTTIDLSNLKVSDNAGDWCTAPRTAVISPVTAWHTVKPTPISSSTKVGHTQAPHLPLNADIPETVEIDYRARGNFAKACCWQSRELRLSSGPNFKNGNLTHPALPVTRPPVLS